VPGAGELKKARQGIATSLGDEETYYETKSFKSGMNIGLLISGTEREQRMEFK